MTTERTTWDDAVMVNERLRRSMLRAGLGAEALAERAQVSVKTVERWVRGEVVPYPRTRYRVAALLGEDESYLWPGAVDRASLAGAELVAAYPRRSDVPAGAGRTRRGMRSERGRAGVRRAVPHRTTAAWTPLLAGMGRRPGATVRLLLGDPAGEPGCP